MHGVDKIGGWGSKVGAFAGLVGLHDRDPLFPACVVALGLSLSRLECLYGLFGRGQEHKSGWTAQALLGGGDDDVNAPFAHADLLRGDGAYAVEDQDGLGRNSADDLAESLCVGENTGGGVYMCERDCLVLFLLELCLDVCEGGLVADGRLELCDLGTVDFETLSERVAKVAGIEDEDVLSGLDDVGGHVIPAERARACRDDWLCFWC